MPPRAPSEMEGQDLARVQEFQNYPIHINEDGDIYTAIIGDHFETIDQMPFHVVLPRAQATLSQYHTAVAQAEREFIRARAIEHENQRREAVMRFNNVLRSLELRFAIQAVLEEAQIQFEQ